MTAAKPYNVFTDPAIAVDHGGPLDAVEAWDKATTCGWGILAAGDRLAKHATSLRTWTTTLERENAELRGLVERARNRIDPDDPAWGMWADWIDDAERVLAAGTGDDRG